MKTSAISNSKTKTKKTTAPLSEEMTAIIKTHSTIAEITAGAGTGKTFVITKRIQWLLGQGVSEIGILCLTFSKHSVNVLRRRFAELGYSGVAVKTFHSYALGLAMAGQRQRKDNGAEVDGAPKKAAVLSEKEALCLVAEVRAQVSDRIENGELWTTDMESQDERSRQLRWLESMDSPEGDQLILSYLRREKASKTSFDSLLEADGMFLPSDVSGVIQMIADAYQEAKAALGGMDFGDMIKKARDALKRKRIAPAYKYLIVDEYQDCSADQALLLRDLHAYIPNLMAFGDSEQAVYGFAGATYTPLRALLPKVRLFKLTHSFRLNQQTADLAMSVLAHDKAVLKLSAGTHGMAPVLIVNDDQDQQAQEVARDIVGGIRGGAAAKDFVVVARTRAVLESTRRALLAQGIPSGEGDIQATAVHAKRVAWMIDSVERRTEEQQISAANLKAKFESITAEQETWDRAAKALAQVNATSAEGRFEQCTQVYLGLFGGNRKSRDLLAELRYWRPLSQTVPSGRHLYDKIREICAAAPILATTIHGAKGGEWNNVAVVGVTEGLLPIYLANMPIKVAEERRLLYVAITRARNQLRLYHAPVQHPRSRQSFDEVSSMLSRALKKNLLKVEKGWFTDHTSSRQNAHKPAPEEQLPLALKFPD